MWFYALVVWVLFIVIFECIEYASFFVLKSIHVFMGTSFGFRF